MKKNKKKKITTSIMAVIIIIIISFILGLIIIDKIILNNKEDKVNEVKNDNYNIKYIEEEKIFNNKNGTIIFVNKKNIIDITNDSKEDIAFKIEKYLNDITNTNWNNLNKQSEEYAYGLTYDKPYGVNYSFKTAKINKNYISIKYETTGSLGGTSWNDTNGYVFDTENGNTLTLKDITNNKDSLLDLIYNKIIQEFDKTSLSLDWKESIQNTGSWYFDNTGLVLNPKFKTNNLKNATISISYNELNNHLLDKYK